MVSVFTSGYVKTETISHFFKITPRFCYLHISQSYQDCQKNFTGRSVSLAKKNEHWTVVPISLHLHQCLKKAVWEC